MTTGCCDVASLYVQVTAFQMSVLLQYNDADRFTVKDLLNNTQMNAVSVYLLTFVYLMSVVYPGFHCGGINLTKC